MSRGLTNNNPGNLRDLGITWVGLDTPRADADGYLRFKAPLYGLRALARDLRNKWSRDNLRTIGDIIEKYAPPGDKNPTIAYINFIAKRLAVGPCEVINLLDDAVLLAFIKSIVQFENGIHDGDPLPYSDDQIKVAMAAALTRSDPIGSAHP